MSTHGKTAMDAFWSGSLTPVIADRSPVPLLLVPIRAPT
jgi:nucleotide-binding universal stress UspA family protein